MFAIYVLLTSSFLTLDWSYGGRACHLFSPGTGRLGPEYDGCYWHVVAGVDPSYVKLSQIIAELGNQRLIVSQGFRMIVYQEPQDSSSEVEWKDQSCREIWLDQKNVFMNFLPENIIMRATCWLKILSRYLIL